MGMFQSTSALSPYVLSPLFERELGRSSIPSEFQRSKIHPVSAVRESFPEKLYHLCSQCPHSSTGDAWKHKKSVGWDFASLEVCRILCKLMGQHKYLLLKRCKRRGEWKLLINNEKQKWIKPVEITCGERQASFLFLKYIMEHHRGK